MKFVLVFFFAYKIVHLPTGISNVRTASANNCYHLLRLQSLALLILGEIRSPVDEVVIWLTGPAKICHRAGCDNARNKLAPAVPKDSRTHHPVAWKQSLTSHINSSLINNTVRLTLWLFSLHVHISQSGWAAVPITPALFGLGPLELSSRLDNYHVIFYFIPPISEQCNCIEEKYFWDLYNKMII